MKINVPMIGKRVPEFEARTTNGNIVFPRDFSGQWIILYSYIGDFLPISALDILAFNDALPKFKSYNTTVLGMSADSIADHLAWIRALSNLRSSGRSIDIELISDRTFDIAKKYGIINYNNDTRNNERALFIIDSDGILRAAYRFAYNVGINVREIERALLAAQTGRAQSAHVAGDWTPGDEVVEYPPQTLVGMQNNIAQKEATGGRCIDWYICYRQDTGERMPSPTRPPVDDISPGPPASQG